MKSMKRKNPVMLNMSKKQSETPKLVETLWTVDIYVWVNGIVVLYVYM